MSFINRNKKLAAAIKIFFLIVFCLYSCSISFFTHTHIINGVTIVHSHFYAANEDGNPGHEHTGAEIQLIASLSTYFTFALIVLTVLLGIFELRARVLTTKPELFILQSTHFEYSRLRPPPVL